MLNHESLIDEGFELNEYPEGKFYEMIIDAPNAQLLDVLNYSYDPEWMPEKIIVQMREDFSNVVVMIDVDVFEYSIEELEKLLEIL